MSGRPAARQGDPTVHGGAIVAGSLDVLIGGQPAARMGDAHVCPLCDGPKPHGGGPLAGGAATVLVNGLPVARQADLATCASPAPDAVAVGCPTVLVGDGASGGGGGHGGAAVRGARAGLLTTASAEAPGGVEGTRWLEAEVVDAAGLPLRGGAYRLEGEGGRAEDGRLRLDGRVVRRGLEQAADYTLTVRTVCGANWSAAEARVGEEVDLYAAAPGYAEGTRATFRVYRTDAEGPRVAVAELSAEVRREEVRARWAYEEGGEPPARKQAPRAASAEGAAERGPAPNRGNGTFDAHPIREAMERPLGGDTAEGPAHAGAGMPSYVFEVVVGEGPTAWKASSGPLVYRDWIELELIDAQGRPLAGAPYRLLLANGAVRTGTSDAQGMIREDDVPPGDHRLL